MVRGLTPKAKAAAAASPSHSARQEQAHAAHVKLERAESATLLTVKKLKGDAPPNEIPSSHAIDHENQVVFFNTYDETAKYGSEIYSCNLKNKMWTNITKSIKYLPHPIGTPERPRQLPSRYAGAMAYYKAKSSGQRLLFLFGGQINGTDEDDLGEVSNELIAIDIDNAKWWTVEVAGGAITARLWSDILIVDDRLFIFGGKTYVDGQAQSVDSYSIATVRNYRWSWEVCDVPYPGHLKSLGFCSDSAVIHDGDTKKILLAAGFTDSEVGLTGSSNIDLSSRSFIVFDIHLRTFHERGAGNGTFPGNVSWYDISALPENMTPSKSTVLCTFHADSARWPELYVYSPLQQAGNCKPLDIGKHIAATRRNFEFFATVGSSLYLLGWTETTSKWDLFAEIPRRWICE
ncbi:hypothetical protein C8R43DRAFT_1004934 [Mycena crocata]|nr:hypothetical protein C8R43DRAFT_1004934 [Mycena crocata]